MARYIERWIHHLHKVLLRTLSPHQCRLDFRKSCPVIGVWRLLLITGYGSANRLTVHLYHLLLFLISHFQSTAGDGLSIIFSITCWFWAYHSTLAKYGLELVCIDRERNPVRLRDRRALYHSATDADHLVTLNPWQCISLWDVATISLYFYTRARLTSCCTVINPRLTSCDTVINPRLTGYQNM